MKNKAYAFAGAFLASAVVIAGLCGFAVVDLSTEYYMPGHFEPMMQINRIDAEGAEFVLMGEHFLIDAAPLRQAEAALQPWRALLPAAPQWAAMLAEQACRGAEAALERLLPRDEEI